MDAAEFHRIADEPLGVRTVTYRAWLPTRVDGRWCWFRTRIEAVEVFHPDGVWNVGDWVTLSRRVDHGL